MIAQNRKNKVSMAIIASLIAVFLLLTMIPSASAADIHVLGESDYEKLDAGDSVTIDYVIYNNGTDALLITGTVYPGSSSGVDAKFSDSFLTLDAGSSAIMEITFTASKDVDNAETQYFINFTATSLTDLSDSTSHSYNMTLKTISYFGVEAGQNKIFNKWDNNLPAPLDGNEGAFLVTVLGWLAIALAFYFVVDPTVHMLTKKTKTDLDDIVLRITRLPVFMLIVLIGSVSSIEILDISQSTVSDIQTVYSILLVLIGTWLVYKIYVEVVLYYAKKFASKTETEIDDVLIPVLEKIGMILFPFLGLMIICQILGYDLTVLLAGAGFLGIVVGYAAQDTLGNFFAGIQLLLDRPFKVGDLLLMDTGDFGEVKHIGLRACELLDTTNNQLVVIPNSSIANNKIVNVVMPDKELTIAVTIGVAYGSDLELVKKLMMDAVGEMSGSKKTKAPAIRLSEFADSAINMKIFIPIEDAPDKWRSASEYREIVYKKFNQNKIEIPFPQQVVYLKTDQQKQ